MIKTLLQLWVLSKRKRAPLFVLSNFPVCSQFIHRWVLQTRRDGHFIVMSPFEICEDSENMRCSISTPVNTASKPVDSFNYGHTRNESASTLVLLPSICSSSGWSLCATVGRRGPDRSPASRLWRKKFELGNESQRYLLSMCRTRKTK